MDRRQELIEIVCRNDPQNRVRAEKLIDEVIFIEDQLVELKKMPFIKIHPQNPALQKATPAAKIYKELLQQYNNSLKLLFRIAGDFGETEEDSPLRRWIKSRKELSG
jgi:hypothetical protein